MATEAPTADGIHAALVAWMEQTSHDIRGLRADIHDLHDKVDGLAGSAVSTAYCQQECRPKWVPRRRFAYALAACGGFGFVAGVVVAAINIVQKLQQILPVAVPR